MLRLDSLRSFMMQVIRDLLEKESVSADHVTVPAVHLRQGRPHHRVLVGPHDLVQLTRGPPTPGQVTVKPRVDFISRGGGTDCNMD